MIKKVVKLFKNNKFQYMFIVLYGMLMVFAMAKPGYIYGSKVDWISQHTVFPEIFRNHFYETGDILPEFFFNIGAGQNAYNFAYYGFLSPIILLSYLFPFIDMTVYIAIVSVVLFILTGILAKKFFGKHFGKNIGFVAAIIVLSLTTLNLHFHRHIMFVWYFPFLMLGLIGLDRYFEKKKPVLFMVSTFFLILTNYLYAVPCLMCLCAYAVYRILKDLETEFTWKEFFKKAFGCVFIFAAPLLMSGILLVPAAHSLFANSRPSETVFPTRDLVVPKAKEIFYNNYSIGITFTMFMAIIGNFTCKGTKKSEKFLNIVLLALILLPVITYALNGFLYVRGKILIPFAILYIYNMIIFIRNLKDKKVKVWLTAAISLVAGVLFVLTNNEPGDYTKFFVLFFIEPVIVCLFRKKQNIILAATVLLLMLSSIVTSPTYLTHQYYDSMHYDEIESLVKSIDGEGYFRTDVADNEYENSNKLYSDRHYNTSVFSSTNNALYLSFYNDNIGNNFYHYCNLVTAGSRNELFHTFMGTRYVVSSRDPGFLYEKINEGKNLALYENKNCYPIAYKSSSIMSEAEFDSLEFPYSVAYMMNNTVIEGDFVSDYAPEFEIVDVPTEYTASYDSRQDFQIDLGEEYVGKYLYLTFDVDTSGEYKNKNDIYIIIDGSQNLVSRDGYIYYNDNKTFEYVIALEDDAILDITAKGKFNIKNLRMYTSDMLHSGYEAVNDFEIDKNNSSFSCNVNGEEGEYFVTTIPYDTNFKAYVNGKEAEILLVNKAFMGVKLQQGTNDIEFRYDSPFVTIGCAMSVAGLLLFAAVLYYDKIKKKLMKRKTVDRT